MLEIRNLAVSFPSRLGDIHAVRDVSFGMAAGERVAIIGESGSGKSMTVLAMLGLQAADARVQGSVTWQGRTARLDDARAVARLMRREAGIVFQDSLTGLNPVSTIGTQLAEVLELRGWPRGRALAEAARVLARVGMPDAEARLRAFPHELSGGMRQRVMIAMAMLAKPGLLVADEPTTALDMTVQAQVIELIRAVRAETGMSLLLITHDLAMAAEVCDRALVVYAGHVVEDVPMAVLQAAPAHPYSHALLQAMPKLDSPRDRPLEQIEGEPPSARSRFTGCPFAPRCPRQDAACVDGIPPLVEHGPAHAVRCLHPMGPLSA